MTILHLNWDNETVKPIYNAALLPPVDLAFADPPYNIGVEYADDVTRDRRPLVEYQAFVCRTLSQLRTVMRSGGLLWWMAPPEQIEWLPKYLTSYFGPRLHSVIWYETFAQYQQKTLTKDWRFLFCHRTHAEGATVFNPDDPGFRIESVRQKMNDPRADSRGRVPGSVWQMRRLQGTSKHAVNWHPNQIPPELLERIIRGWSNPGDTVMDLFAGSGSMGIQAARLGRRFVGVDKSKTYCMKMMDRIAEASKV